MNFTNLEKQAIFHLLVRMSLIDNNVDTKELLLVSAICEKIDITENERNKSENLDIENVLNIISNLTSVEKDFVCAALGALIAIDNDIDKKEMLLWGLITERCGFPEMNLSQAKDKLQKYIFND